MSATGSANDDTMLTHDVRGKVLAACKVQLGALWCFLRKRQTQPSIDFTRLQFRLKGSREFDVVRQHRIVAVAAGAHSRDSTSRARQTRSSCPIPSPRRLNYPWPPRLRPRPRSANDRSERVGTVPTRYSMRSYQASLAASQVSSLCSPSFFPFDCLLTA